MKHTSRSDYRVVGLNEFLLEGNDPKPLSPLIDVSIALPATTLSVCPVQFGTTSPPDFPCLEFPPGWNPGTIDIPEIKVYTLADAIVHGETGLVTVGDLLIRESIKLPGYQHFDLRWVGKDILSIPRNEPCVFTKSGAHIFCGYPGNRNYAHFLMDIITSALVSPLHDAYEDTTIILPQILKAYQEEYLGYFPELAKKSIFLKEHALIACQALKMSTFGMMNAHHLPHPYHIEVVRMLRERMLLKHPGISENMPKKIYVNRLDANARRLVNEDSVIECAERHGYVSVSLSGLSVSQQAALFWNATHVIAPHGAGATNILYCKPGPIF